MAPKAKETPWSARRPRSTWRTTVWPAGLGVGLLGVLLAATLASAAPLATDARPTAPAAGTSTTTTFPTPIRHVITVVLENAGYSTVLANGPFEKHLNAVYAHATHYYAVCHPSAPNYLAMTSGAPWQCGSDGYKVYSTSNIADLVQNKGRTWASFDESMPTACDTTNSATGDYVVRHDPFVYYHDIVGNRARCTSHVVSLSAFATDVSLGTVPNYAFITPNILDDGHNTGVKYADTWLKGWLSPLLNNTLFRTTVFFIVYDEAVNDNSGYDGLTGGHVYFTAVSPYTKTGAAFTSDASHYNLLTTTEWLLGLGNCGHHDSGTSFPPMKGLFNFSLPASPGASAPTVAPLAVGAAPRSEA